MRRVLPVSRLRLGRIERYVLIQQARSLLVALGVIAALMVGAALESAVGTPAA